MAVDDRKDVPSSVGQPIGGTDVDGTKLTIDTGAKAPTVIPQKTRPLRLGRRSR